MGQTDFEYGFNDPDYKTDDPPSYAQACMGILVCPHCGKSVMCSDITNPMENNDNMTIPRSDAASTNSSGSGRRKKGAGLRYLSADMLTTTRQLASIADARVQPDNFKPNGPDVVLVKLKFKGEFILWTLRSNNPNMTELGDALGDDEQNWKGKEVELYLEEDSFDGKKWIRAEPVTASTATTKRK